jgi:hypothetical protein
MKANNVTNLLLETFPSEDTQLIKKFFMICFLNKYIIFENLS